MGQDYRRAQEGDGDIIEKQLREASILQDRLDNIRTIKKLVKRGRPLTVGAVDDDNNDSAWTDIDERAVILPIVDGLETDARTRLRALGVKG